MLFIITVVLDGMNFLPAQLATFNRLKTDWRWIVVEGTSKATNCTAWCADQPPGVSKDGSHSWLKEIAEHHPKVIHAYEESWDGKIAMFHRATRIIDELASSHPGEHVVMEIDADELWLAEQLDKIVTIFANNPSFHWMRFWCRYFLGPNIAITTRNTYGNRSEFEWARAWRHLYGFRFLKHEPPIVNHPLGLLGLDCNQTERMGLRFDHQAYFYQSQVRHKEQFYKYAGLNAQWLRLQRNTSWPARVGDFLTHVTDNAMCDQIWEA